MTVAKQITPSIAKPLTSTPVKTGDSIPSGISSFSQNTLSSCKNPDLLIPLIQLKSENNTADELLLNEKEIQKNKKQTDSITRERWQALKKHEIESQKNTQWSSIKTVADYAIPFSSIFFKSSIAGNALIITGSARLISKISLDTGFLEKITGLFSSDAKKTAKRIDDIVSFASLASLGYFGYKLQIDNPTDTIQKAVSYGSNMMKGIVSYKKLITDSNVSQYQSVLTSIESNQKENQAEFDALMKSSKETAKHNQKSFSAVLQLLQAVMDTTKNLTRRN